MGIMLEKRFDSCVVKEYKSHQELRLQGGFRKSETAFSQSTLPLSNSFIVKGFYVCFPIELYVLFYNAICILV